MTTVHIYLTATKEQTQQPILWKLGRDFEIEINILKANIDEDSSWALVQLKGPVEEIQRATAWLHTTGVKAEPVERSVK